MVPCVLTNLTALSRVNEFIKATPDNCVAKARAGFAHLVELGCPPAAVNFANCLTETREQHRVLVVNTTAGQVVLCGRQRTPMRLDDVPYTDWYGGKELT